MVRWYDGRNFIKFDKVYKVCYNLLMDKYSDKLRQILDVTGWSQESLAAKLDTTFVTLNAWVNEKAIPRDKAKEKIDLLAADILGADAVNLDELKIIKAEACKHKYTAKKIVSDPALLKAFTTSLTYHSNGTEGSTLNQQDVEAVIFDNQILKNHTAIEQREAVNHQTALYFLLDELVENGDDFVFTPELILAVHLRMMNGIASDAGAWRNHAVHVTGSQVARANYVKIPSLISNWCNEVNGETTDPIGLMARSHAEFEKIHPFSDGNGRTGRLLLFALAFKLGLMPPILHKERRLAYYRYLELANGREILDPLELFIAKAIVETDEGLKRETL